jgi:hypothetical protein
MDFDSMTVYSPHPVEHIRERFPYVAHALLCPGTAGEFCVTWNGTITNTKYYGVIYNYD